MLRPTLKADDFLVAASPAMRAVTAAVERYADGDSPVLICGEHGTGRELVARVLHRRGPDRCSTRAISSRPVPCSPQIRTGTSPSAYAPTRLTTCFIAGLSATRNVLA
ncbi:MAG TPA: sigma 54-interacting transcriptional regulator, partial [Kofleriaceae bacterium]